MSQAAKALIEAVEALLPVVAERADETEAARTLPPELLAQLDAAGLFRMFVPRRFGGLQVDLRTGLEVIERLARADGATGWTVMIGAGDAAPVRAPPAGDVREALRGRPRRGARRRVQPPGAGGRRSRRIPGVRPLGVRERQRALRLAVRQLRGDGRGRRAPPERGARRAPGALHGVPGRGGAGARHLARARAARHRQPRLQRRGAARRRGPQLRPLRGRAVARRARVRGAGAPVRAPHGGGRGRDRPGRGGRCAEARPDRQEASLRDGPAGREPALPLAAREGRGGGARRPGRRCTPRRTRSGQRASRRPSACPTLAPRVTSTLVWVAETAAGAVDALFRAAGGGAARDGAPLQRRFRDIHTFLQHGACTDGWYAGAGAAQLGVGGGGPLG